MATHVGATGAGDRQWRGGGVGEGRSSSRRRERVQAMSFEGGVRGGRGGTCERNIAQWFGSLLPGVNPYTSEAWHQFGRFGCTIYVVGRECDNLWKMDCIRVHVGHVHGFGTLLRVERRWLG